MAHALNVRPLGFYSVHRKRRGGGGGSRLSVICRRVDGCSGDGRQTSRRDVLITPFLAVGAYVFRSAVARAEDEKPISEGRPVVGQQEVVSSSSSSNSSSTAETDATPAVEEELVKSRIYDATVIGEPMALGKDKRKVWEKMMSARIVYLGEAEQVPIGGDKDLELEIVKSLRKKCVEAERPISLALEAFSCDLQEQLDLFVDKRINGEMLKSFVTNWPPERWQEYEPLLNYCCDNGIRLVACGVPLEVLRTVQAEGVRRLSKADRKKFVPPAGSGFISGFSSISKRSSVDTNFWSQSASFGSSSYLSIQARVVEDYTMSQIISQAVTNVGSTGMIVVVTGASHVAYGSRGTGLPARISSKMQKKDQVIILLNPERQNIRREGDTPVADFLWYSAARPCNRNCFDRAEIARVMNAAGGRRDTLPQDIQNGLDLGLVSPEVLQNFFDLEKNPILSGLTHQFQGFRERLLADPKFLHRLAIEETISISTTLLAQYERRKENFFQELDYVVTDTLRGTVVDFFTVWLPAPTLSFIPVVGDMSTPDGIEAVKGLLGSIPDNAFQKSLVGRDWNLNHRIASVLVGGLKLASVGFISSIGTVASSNMLLTARKHLNPRLATVQQNKRSPILRTALVYAAFLGTSANLRYQVIAGIVEHRISDQFSDQIFLVNLISFVARTANSYWGTQQWIDLARYTGLQARRSEDISFEIPDSTNSAALECQIIEETSIDEHNKQ
ncbi:protein RETICULATA-RELATED 6, chloroplastic-like [Andrographis paniculata]|uniref:protein RETICULATA-RELATED 6, chloroplastic-like n=1 Tax=Andrographis paniculata TaxID=175694 RepID=UPI0021E70FAC|nr:protein RETICULATA-RELATED 6, chloroplastic-like [Andrographis paniculata]XP_051122795.1 protein RETICULATA-RELATED 6, chloroplastic-like [Andrographis paniculata]XP_051122797.1 protein RETICULATA-RELATED 6, chloroplastic-like [Andrographis paniculata]XP_051122798.1 protein RETICULATA-RELATED 6, chloroplastic-like [Andrographis paniculata]XP_051122799.1 protein RETICULATA-RELATED 6, chloroplastic-like [Andrographis paniculata]XP_051122800.1 protein RETICULATA-RELATED 6, chloroplastic-like [